MKILAFNNPKPLTYSRPAKVPLPTPKFFLPSQYRKILPQKF